MVLCGSIRGRVMGKLGTHLLAVTRFAVLPLSSMNKSRGFSVETVQTIGLLIDESVVLRNELPADFGRVDGGSSCHDETVS